MKETNPIKRSPELQPLSREHHDGLLFVWKIRQGIKRGIAIERLTDFVSWYWKNHIRPHFFQEEKILMPRIMHSPLAERMKTEHDYIRELLHDIEKDPLREDFVRLSDHIEQHIRFEERELFQYLEDSLSPNELSGIHDLLEKHPVETHCKNPVADVWKDEFWVTQKDSTDRLSSEIQPAITKTAFS